MKTENVSDKLEPIKTLSYRCLQWEDGEIKGYDSQMMDSLLPLMIKPILDEVYAKGYNDATKQACEEIAKNYHPNSKMKKNPSYS